MVHINMPTTIALFDRVDLQPEGVLHTALASTIYRRLPLAMSRAARWLNSIEAPIGLPPPG
jgi:hypothetical protein